MNYFLFQSFLYSGYYPKAFVDGKCFKGVDFTGYAIPKFSYSSSDHNLGPCSAKLEMYPYYYSWATQVWFAANCHSRTMIKPAIPGLEAAQYVTVFDMFSVKDYKCPNGEEPTGDCNCECIEPKIWDRNTSSCKSPDNCELADTKFSSLASNERELFRWKKDNDLSSKCLAIPALVQEKRVNCEMEYRCVKEVPTKCPRDIEVGSYVSPTTKIFHEDINLIGTPIKLHYQSGYFNNNTIAKGWSLDVHHILEVDYLYLGNGKIFNIIDYKTQENNITTIHMKNKDYIFDENGTHMMTQDSYTHKVLYRFKYDNNQLVSIDDTYGNELNLDRDVNGTLLAIVATTGQKNYVNIDAQYDLVRIDYEDNTGYAFSYDNHLMVSETEPNGNKFIHEYDALGKIVRVIDAQEGIWNFSNTQTTEYSETLVQKAEGDTTAYKDYFMTNNQLRSETILSNGTIYTTISDLNYTHSQTDRCGVQTLLTYAQDKDEVTQEPYLQNIVKSMPSGLSENIEYLREYIFDTDGTLLSKKESTETNGAVQTTLRDYEHFRATTTSPEGRESEIEYNEDNLLPQKVQIAGLKPIEYEYDEKGRVTRVKQGKRAVEYVYDTRGNLAQEINKKEKKIIKYSYDAKDRVIETILADGSTLKYSYDANGNMTRLTTPTPTEHNFAYNGVNRRTSMTSPLGYTTHYTYDKQRRVTQITRASGKTIQNHYEAGELKSITTPEGVTEYSYTCGSKVSTLSNNAESINYSYDGELLTQLQTKGILNQTIEYSYNNNFLIASTNYADATTTYAYDKDNLLTQSGTFTLTRDEESGMLKSISDGRFKQNYKYNKYGEIKKIKSKNYKLSLKRKNSQISQKTEEINYLNKKQKHKKRRCKQKSKVTYHYAYDKQGRLISVKRNKKEVEHYTYDANGNRVEAKVYGVTTQAYYTLDDQIERYGENSYRYDADGYLVEKTTPQGTTTYTYNTLGALTEVSTPTKTINYHLNALNQRVAKEVDGVITQKYLWRDLTTLLAIYDKDDNLIQRFNYTNNRMPTSMTQDNQTYYLHYDQVGTLRLITDDNNNIIKEITYDSYGNILKDTNQNFTIPFGFAGGLHDRDTGLVHFGYREYDPHTGKWTAKDPIDFSGGDSNLYGYVLGDPVNFVDPEGLASLHTTFILVGIGMGMYTYNQINDMISGSDYLSKSKVCYDIAAQYDYSIGKVDDMCISDIDKSIYKLELNKKKQIALFECLKIIGAK